MPSPRTSASWARWVAFSLGTAACGLPSYTTSTEKREPAAEMSMASPVVREPALLAYWPFDDETGSVARDDSGRGHDATLIANGAPPLQVWTTGKVGGAFAFDGQTFFRAPYSPDWDEVGATKTFTVVAWVLRQRTSIGWNTLVSRQFQVTQWEHFNLGFKSDNLAPVASTQIDELWYCTAPSPSTNGVWTHVAGTYDGSTLRGYENGIEVCRIDFPAALPNDDTGVIIGGKTNGPGPLVEQAYTGLIDEVAIYSRALDTREIARFAARP